MTENIVTGKKYRILTDATQDIWDRISFWTKASDVYYDDNSNAEANRPIGILKRGTAYVVGTVAYEITAPSWVMLKCTTAGTTAASTPSTYKTISSSGTVITDGTAKFTVYDIRPTTTLSTNAYSVPTVSLLNTQISNIPKKFDDYYVISSFPFYAPHDCICQMYGTNQAGAGGYYMYFDINDVMTWPFAGVTPVNWQISHTFFMKKGQKLTLREGAGLIYWGVRVTEIIP